MTPAELEKWRNRPTTVRTLTRCDECGELKRDPAVQLRKYESGYYEKLEYSAKSTCCVPCFEVVKARAKAEAQQAAVSES